MIVALEAASADQSVAVADATGGLLAQSSWTAPRGQGGELLPRLLALLNDRHASLADISAVAVGIGPGSFTGLRVALSLAKGLAMGLDRPIVGRSQPRGVAGGRARRHRRARAGWRGRGLRPGPQRRRGAAPRSFRSPPLSDEARRMTIVAPGELAAALTLGHAAPPTGAAAAVASSPPDDWRPASLTSWPPWSRCYLRPPRGLAEMTEGAVTWL